MDKPPVVKEYWFPFPHKIVRSGKWANLSMSAKATYIGLAVYADFNTAECYPSLNTIAKASGVSRSTVSVGIAELVKEGLLVRDSGDYTRSNRYKMVEWPRLTPSEPGEIPDGPSPAPGPPPRDPSPAPGLPYTASRSTPTPADKPPLAREPVPKDNQLTTANRTTTTNDGGDKSRRSGRLPLDGEAGVQDLTETLARELGLKAMGLRDLEQLIKTYSPQLVLEACHEAVSNGRATLKYMKGILRNWAKEGKGADRTTRKESAAAKDRAKMETERREREASRLRQERRYEARQIVKAKLAECDADELAAWRAEAEKEAAERGLTGRFQEESVKMTIQERVALKYGIEGL